nr:unnamed protein product [Callosobruchus analis]
MNVSYLEEEILKSNVTLEQCRSAYADDSQRLADAHPEGFCRVAFDSVLCWPPTPLNQTATVKYKADAFLNTLTYHFNNAFPVVNNHKIEENKNWTNNNLRELKQLLLFYHSNLKNSPSQGNKELYNQCKLNYGGSNSVICVSIVTLLHYFHITTFFWMFVEGLYLYILVVETLTRENFKLRVYLLIGWGEFNFVLLKKKEPSILPKY